MNAVMEYHPTKPVSYDYGGYHGVLHGDWAFFYKTMVWMLGREKASEEFWMIFHKKNSVIPPEDAVLSLSGNQLIKEIIP